MEAMVRAATLEALDDAARKFDRACTHAAEALGAHAEILTYQGYMPVRPAPADPALLAAAAALPGLAQCAEPAERAGTDGAPPVMPVVNSSFLPAAVRRARSTARTLPSRTWTRPISLPPR